MSKEVSWPWWECFVSLSLLPLCKSKFIHATQFSCVSLALCGICGQRGSGQLWGGDLFPVSIDE